MNNRLFNLGLLYPDKIDSIVKILNGNNYVEVLEGVRDIWLKSGRLISVESINNTTDLEIKKEDVGEGDLLWFIEEYNKQAKEDIVRELMESANDFEIDDVYSMWNENIIDIEPPNIITSSTMDDIKNDIHMMKNRVEERVDTGFKQFNELLNKDGHKGWAKKYSYLFQGLTGTGKTFFLSNIATRALIQGLKVVYVSIEMDQWQIRDLIYRSYFNTSDINTISTKRVTPSDFELTVITYSNMSHNMFDVQSDINKLANKPDLVVIDYLDKFKPSMATQQSWQVQEVVSNDIIRVAQELDLPIVTATQTNRQAAGENGGTKRNMGYESTGSSFNKTYGFAGIWSLITDDADYDDSTGCRNFDLICNKNREGKQTKTHFTLNYNNAKLYEPHEFGILNQNDSYLKQAAQGKLRAEIGMENETEEEKKETLESFNRYFENLKDDPDYKEEIKQISLKTLSNTQKTKLRKAIRKHQEDNSMTVDELKKIFGRK